MNEDDMQRIDYQAWRVLGLWFFPLILSPNFSFSAICNFCCLLSSAYCHEPWISTVNFGVPYIRSGGGATDVVMPALSRQRSACLRRFFFYHLLTSHTSLLHDIHTSYRSWGLGARHDDRCRVQWLAILHPTHRCSLLFSSLPSLHASLSTFLVFLHFMIAFHIPYRTLRCV